MDGYPFSNREVTLQGYGNDDSPFLNNTILREPRTGGTQGELKKSNIKLSLLIIDGFNGESSTYSLTSMLVVDDDNYTLSAPPTVILSTPQGYDDYINHPLNNDTTSSITPLIGLTAIVDDIPIDSIVASFTTAGLSTPKIRIPRLLRTRPMKHSTRDTRSIYNVKKFSGPL
jgi:hypothetical protein